MERLKDLKETKNGEAKTVLGFRQLIKNLVAQSRDGSRVGDRGAMGSLNDNVSYSKQ